MKELPKKLNRDTIIDSVVELRFDTSLPRSVVFGVIYNEIKDEFPVVEESALASIPESVRNNDPNLGFQPLYRVKNDKYVVQIGTNMIAISSFPNYLGWKEFSEKCKWLVQVVYRLKVISVVQRIGVRYINRFEGDIIRDTNVNLSFSSIEGEVSFSNLIFHINYPDTVFNSMIQYRLETMGISSMQTTVVDIDTSIDKLESSEFDYVWSKIEEGHTIEKRIFFGLLQDHYIDSLGPNY